MKKEKVYHLSGASGGITKKEFEIRKKYHRRILAEDSAEEREKLYEKAYDRLYKFNKKYYPKQEKFGYVDKQIYCYRKIIENGVAVDYGCGYGYSTTDLAKFARKVYGIESNNHVIEQAKHIHSKYKNVTFCKSIGFNIPIPDESVDVVYSNDFIEHLHPDDLITHLKEILRILSPKGCYICITPNRKYGPFDITEAFLPRGSEPQGMHLKEYSYKELVQIFRDNGFGKIQTAVFGEELFILTKLYWLYTFFLRSPEYKYKLEKYSTSILSNKYIAIAFGIRSVRLIAWK